MDILGWQLALAGFVSWAMEYLKNSSWFTVSDHTTEVFNRGFSWFLAIATSVGLTLQWDPTVGVLTIGGLLPYEIAKMAGLTLQQRAFQWMAYKGFVSGEKH